MKIAKYIITLFTCLLFLEGFSQLRLVIKKPKNIYATFTLKEDNSFSYKFQSCLSALHGEGKYSKSGRKFTFEFDSFANPKIIKGKTDTLSNIVKIKLEYIGSESAYEDGELIYRGDTFRTNTNGLLNIKYTSGTIGIIDIYHPEKPLTYINPKVDSCNNYKFLWLEFLDSSIPKGRIITMKKYLGKYRCVETWQTYDEQTKRYKTQKSIKIYKRMCSNAFGN